MNEDRFAEMTWTGLMGDLHPDSDIRPTDSHLTPRTSFGGFCFSHRRTTGIPGSVNVNGNPWKQWLCLDCGQTFYWPAGEEDQTRVV